MTLLRVKFASGLIREMPAPDLPVWLDTRTSCGGKLMPHILIDGMKDADKARLLLGKVTEIEFVEGDEAANVTALDTFPCEA